jgi:hypothetical protein
MNLTACAFERVPLVRGDVHLVWAPAIRPCHKVVELADLHPASLASDRQALPSAVQRLADKLRAPKATASFIGLLGSGLEGSIRGATT